MKLRTLSILVAIILIAFFLRFFKLGDIPSGLYQDETSIGYNAYSILETGKDEYGENLPLYFKSFGDQKLPVYIYTDVLAVKLFGLTPFAVRLPSAFFGFLTVVVFYFFIKDITRKRDLAIVSTLLLAINPWSLHYNRAAFEVSMSLFFFVLGGYLLNKFFNQKTHGALFLGTICFIVSLYSYSLTRLLAPLLFLLFIIVNKDKINKSSKKEMLFTAILAILSLIPFFITFFQGGGVSAASGTLIHSSAVVQAQFLELRMYMSVLPNAIEYLFFNKYILTIWQFITNIFSYFSIEFFFIKGSLHGNHGIGNVGMFYLFELPLIIIGVYNSIRKKNPGINLLIGWVTVTILVASLTRDVPHATRSFFLVVPILTFSSIGIVEVYSFIIKQKNNLLKYSLAISCMGFVVFNIIYYFSSYYTRFPILYAKAWRNHDKELSQYLNENSEKYDKIVIDEEAGFAYVSHLFYSKFQPSEFQTSAKRLPDDREGFSKVLSYGKVEYRYIEWKTDKSLPKTIFVTVPDRLPPEIKQTHTIYYPTRPTAYPKDQEIYSIPVKEAAYVLVETK